MLILKLLFMTRNEVRVRKHKVLIMVNVLRNAVPRPIFFLSFA